MTYKLLKLTSLFECEPHAVCIIETGAYVPFQSNNSDYQEYLKWLAKGNTPQPAD